MNGFIYRTGVRIKDFGERLGHLKLFRIRIFRIRPLSWIPSLIICFGLALRGCVRKCTIASF